ncbi:MAG: ATP-dependent Clp protease ATP-binding subunit [Candidatus Beckwithbacteria bacterium]
MNKLVHFPIFWYKDSLIWFRRLFKNLLTFLNNKLAVSLMIQMLFVPLFHDASFLGRILSFIFRAVRILIGGTIIILTLISMVFWLSVWLVIPIAVVWVGKETGWIILLALWLIDILKQKGELQPEVSRFIRSVKGKSETFKELLINSSRIKPMLIRLEIDPKELESIAALSDINQWLNEAKAEAKELGSEQVEAEHFLLAWLKQANWRYREAKLTLKWLKRQKSWAKTPFIWEKSYEPRPIGGIDRAWTGIPTPTLDKYSQDLTRLAEKRQLPEMFGKQEATEQLTQILSRREKNNVLVVGEPGSGKSTLVKSLAQEIVRGVKTGKLKFKRLVALDASQLAAGADEGELNQRMTQIISEIKAAGNIILFVDEVHNLAMINQDKAETSNIFRALEPALDNGEFQFIGATTTTNYKKYLEPNGAFSRLFETVTLAEATKDQTLEILEYLGWEQEREEEVVITLMALLTIIDLSQALIHDRVFPDRAVNLLDEVVAVIKSQELNQVVTAADVRQLLTKKTHVPLNQLTKDEAKLLLNLEKKLHQRVVGQETAIKAISEAIRRARTGLKEQNKPIASFLFAGPTGVGKTETAKALAAEWFGEEKNMVRLDMSEFQNLDSLNRLIGAPGSDEGGQLTEAIRHQPYCLLLLDEIEKAHPKILNLFLQVLDDARLTDGKGKTVDFNNTIIIATTNVGTSLKETKGQDLTLEKIEEFFPPEWLNRLTQIVVFKPLTRPEVDTIVKLKLNRLSQELKKQEIEVRFDPKVVKEISHLGFSAKWGGRQADRIIQEKIANRIAEKILKNELKKRVAVDFSLEWL